MSRHFVLAAAFLAASIVSANAAPILTKQVDFSISGIGPVDPVIGSFKISFDPTQTYTDQTAGLVMNSLNLTVSSPVAFDYNSISGSLLIGGTENGNNGLSSGSFDFSIVFTKFLTTPQILSLAYLQGGPQGFNGDSVSGKLIVNQLSITDVSDVPEPVTISLFGAGFAGVVMARRRGRKA